MPPPDKSAFKQQTLRAWRPILTPRLVILLFSVGGILFIPIGAIILVFSNQVRARCAVCSSVQSGTRGMLLLRCLQVVEVVSEDYSAACCIANCSSRIPSERVDRNPCDIQIAVTERMEPPIFMYFKLTDYYQNHRRYVRSRDDNQLKGDDVTADDLLDSSSCRYHVLASSELSQDDPANLISPCGLIAFSVFNDTFRLFDGASADEGHEVPLSSTGIAWPSDLE